MRILAIVQEFDPDSHILGFLYTWLIKITKQLDELYIVSLEEKHIELEKNIKVYSLGKELGYHKIHQFYNFNRIVADILLKRKVDLVFVLMCPEYVFLVAPYAKIRGIPIVMWYAHGSVSMRLRIASFLIDRIVSSSEDGFRLNCKKLTIVGQGIDVNNFQLPTSNFQIKNNGKKIILSAGRISPIKNYEILINVADILVNKGGMKDFKFIIVGGLPIPDQRDYLYSLKNMVKALNLEDYFDFIGPVSYRDIHNYYEICDLLINTSNTGSLDKVVLEAMACRKLVLTCNEAFGDLLKIHSDILMFAKNDIDSLAEKIIYILNMDAKDKDRLTNDLRGIVARNHNLDSFIDNILTVFKDAIH